MRCECGSVPLSCSDQEKKTSENQDFCLFNLHMTLKFNLFIWIFILFILCLSTFFCLYRPAAIFWQTLLCRNAAQFSGLELTLDGLKVAWQLWTNTFTFQLVFRKNGHWVPPKDDKDHTAQWKVHKYPVVHSMGDLHTVCARVSTTHHMLPLRKYLYFRKSMSIIAGHRQASYCRILQTQSACEWQVCLQCGYVSVPRKLVKCN